MVDQPPTETALCGRRSRSVQQILFFPPISCGAHGVFFFFFSLSLFPREPNSPQLSPSSCDLGWAQRTALDVELSARSLHPPIDDWLGPRVELVGHLATRHIDTRCAMPSLFFTAIDELAHQSAMIVRAIHTLLMAV